MSKAAKINRYYGLQVVSMVYKLLAVLVVFIILGGLGYMSQAAIGAVSESPSDLVVRALALVIGGGLLAFTFFVLAQLVDIQISMNEKMRELVKHSENLETTLNEVKASNQQLIAEMQTFTQQQSRLLRLQASSASSPPPPPASTAQTKVIGNP